MADIFKDENKVKSNWFKFENVGDKIQGTLVSKRKIINQLRGGEEQMVYELKTEGGEYWNVGSKEAIDIQMRHVRLGQIVGFEFIGERKNPKPGMNAAKLIQVYENENVVDEEWLQRQEQSVQEPDSEDAPSDDGDGQGVDTNQIPFTAEKDKKTSTTDLLAEIGELAKTKLKVTEPAQVQGEVMKATKLAFVEENYQKIIDVLKAL